MSNSASSICHLPRYDVPKCWDSGNSRTTLLAQMWAANISPKPFDSMNIYFGTSGSTKLFVKSKDLHIGEAERAQTWTTLFLSVPPDESREKNKVDSREASPTTKAVSRDTKWDGGYHNLLRKATSTAAPWVQAGHGEQGHPFLGLFLLLPQPLHRTELDFTGHIFQKTLACPTAQLVQLKPSLLLWGRNMPVSRQNQLTIQEEPGPALPAPTLLFLQTLRVLPTNSLWGKRGKSKIQ